MNEGINSPRSDNLPTFLSTFIGREQELASLKQLLPENRLVTLTGAGGSGKTRLSIQLANELLDQFEQGVWFIRLAPLSDPKLVPQTVASTLGVHEQKSQTLIDGLTEYLKDHQSLLIFDNCEHLIDACAKLAEKILQTCPNIIVIATSRESLNIPGEVVWTVPPLSLPEKQPWRDPKSGETALSIYRQSESVQLFLNRASSVLPDFELSMDNGAWVAEICRRLDGIPLAIELAAARVRVLSMQQIAERLDDRFNLLTGGIRTAPPRQQTLAATLDWSYALLSDTERRVLQRLSVFAGGATLEAAESVCASEKISINQVLDQLSYLVDKSLVVVDQQPPEVRYRMLETIRAYALKQLIDSDKAGEIYRKHLDWFVNLAEQAESELQGPNQNDWLWRLAREDDNFRVALAWSLEYDTAMALQLAGALGQFWFMRGYLFSESIEWLEKVLSQTEPLNKMAEQAKALRWLGNLTYLHGDDGKSISAYEKSLALYQELGDFENIADSLFYLGDIMAFQGDTDAMHEYYEASRSIYDKAFPILQARGDRWRIARSLNSLGEMARIEADYPAARKYYEESLVIRRQIGDQRGIAISLYNLGYVALHSGDYQRSKVLFQESLGLFQKHGGQRGMIDCVEGLALAAGGTGQLDQAVQLFGAAEIQRETIHSRLEYTDLVEYERQVSAMRAKLDEATFSEAWGKGRGMTLEQAIEYALHLQETSKNDMPLKEKFGGLTAREREVAILIAQGKSNREIAEIMTVREKTVETYITRILNKLGFKSRVEVATWAIEIGLKDIGPDREQRLNSIP